jgi:hypothetical protein
VLKKNLKKKILSFNLIKLFISSRKNKTKFFVYFNIITINLALLISNPKTKIYTTVLNFNRHLLANYILLDNCKVLNLVNNKKLLVLNSFVKLTRDKYIKLRIL